MYATKPVKVQALEPESQERMNKYFTPPHTGEAYYGKGKYVLGETYRKHVDGIRNMPIRDDDVWIATFPRSGTTWTQELAWLICNDLDYKKAAEHRITQRYVYVEFNSLVPEAMVNQMQTDSRSFEMFVDYKTLVDAPSPRFLKTHLPFSLLPPRLVNTSRIVYVARDPRDVAVSYYHQSKLFKRIAIDGNFKEYWNLFKDNLVEYAPFFPHIKEAWALRHHPNMLFLFYEELYSDLPATLMRVAKFFDKKYTDEQILKLSDHLQFDKMKENKAVHPDWLQNSPMVAEGAEKFFRKGKAGGWPEYFDEEMSEQAEAWIRDNLQDTDLRFPKVQG